MGSAERAWLARRMRSLVRCATGQGGGIANFALRRRRITPAA